MRFLKFLFQSPEGKFWTTDISGRFTVGNEHNQVWGADLASATTIAVTHKFHRILGTTAIATITPPYPTFSGEIFLQFAGIVTVGGAGQIPQTFTTAAEEILLLVYNPATQLWRGGLVNAIT